MPFTHLFRKAVWLGSLLLLLCALGFAQEEENEAQTTPMARITDEPEGDMFHLPPVPVDPRVYQMNDGLLSRLAHHIEDGSANMIERRAWWWLKQRLFPFDKPIPSNWRLEAQRRIKAMESARPERDSAATDDDVNRSVTYTWTNIGPATYTNGSDKNSGRATALWVDPSTKNTILLGTADGGVWKTTDQGSTWTSILDSAVTTSIGAIAVDPNNKSVIYAGTGEGNYNGDMVGGVGIYKSTDGGSTWALESLPFLYSGYWQGIRRIAVDKLDSNKVYAAADGGLYYSTDAGSTWTRTICGSSYAGPYYADDVVLDATNGSGSTSIVYASFDADGIYRSTTGGGGTWTKISTGSIFPSSDIGRIALVMAPSDPKQVYALLEKYSTSVNLGIYYTADAHASTVTWVKKSTTSYCSSQCWYDMHGTVDPGNPAKIIVGGLDDYISTNNAQTLTKVSHWDLSGTTYSHADHHFLYMPDSTTVYDANDGGFFLGTVSGSTVTWTNKNAGLPTLQYYGLAQHPTDATKVTGGLQDNGQAYYNGTTWTQAYGGDGGKSAWDQGSSGYAYEEYVYASIQRNSNMTGTPTSWTCIQNFGSTSGCSGNTIPDGRTEFIAPFTLDPNNQNTIYAGSYYLYKNTAARTGSTWTKFSQDMTWGSTNSDDITAIHAAKNNGVSSIIYVGASNGAVTVGTYSGSTWNWTNITTGLATAYITSFVTDPANGQKVLVTLSGYGASHIYRSINGGAAWTDITGLLPAQPFNTIVLSPTDANHAYAGSDYGVFENTAVWTGNTWTSITSNMPAVSVQELGFNVSNGNLRAATHGRGMWELTLSCAPPGAPTITGITDVSACAATGIQIAYTPGSPAGGSYNLLKDGSSVVTGYTSGATYVPTDTNTHTYVVRALNGPSCTTDSTGVAGTDVNNTPGAPAITGITDNNPSVQDGIHVNYTAGSGATSHDLYKDGLPAVTGYSTGALYNPGDTSSHTYVVRAIHGACTTDGTGSAFADAAVSTPPGPVPTIPGSGGATLDKSGSNIAFVWSASKTACAPTTWEIYRGTLGTYYSHSHQVTCDTSGLPNWTGNAGLTDGNSYYYLIVAATASKEGSYGKDSSNNEIPVSTSPCHAQDLSACTP